MQKKLVVILACLFIFISTTFMYADEMGGGGAGFGEYDWKTSEFSFEYDNITFAHHSDGTCDVLNVDGTINHTMSKQETEKKFKALGINFDSYGNISVSYLKNPLDALNYELGILAGSVGTFLNLDYFAEQVHDSIVPTQHSVTQAYFTNSFSEGVTVDTNGNINLTSDKVDEIIKVMKQQYREYTGLYDASDFCGDCDKNDIILRLVEYHGFTNSQVNYVLDWLEQSGYDAIYYGEQKFPSVYGNNVSDPYIYAFNTSAYVYAYSVPVPYQSYTDAKFVDSNLDEIDNGVEFVGGYLRIKDINAGNLNNLSSIFRTSGLDVLRCMGEFNLAERTVYSNYPVYRHLKGTNKFKYYTSLEKLLKDVNGGSETFYYSNEFAPGTHPDGLTITSEQLGEDWEKHNQDIINAIEKGIENVTDEAERQRIIDEIITDKLKDINDNISDLTDTVEEAGRKTNTILRSILKAIQDFNNDFDVFIGGLDLGILNDIKKGIDGILSALKDISSIKTIQDIDVIINNSTDIDINEFKTEINNDFNRCANAFKTKFPTCAIFDMLVVANMLSAEPEAPVISYEFKVSSFNIVCPLVIDFNVFNDYIHYLRGAQVILFIFSLMKITVRLFLGVNGGVI